MYHRESIFQSGKRRGILNRLEKSGNFAQISGKIKDFYIKFWESEGILGIWNVNNFNFFVIWILDYFYFSVICPVLLI